MQPKGTKVNKRTEERRKVAYLLAQERKNNAGLYPGSTSGSSTEFPVHPHGIPALVDSPTIVNQSATTGPILERHRPSKDEITSLFESIKKNIQCRFGLVKLSHLHINGVYKLTLQKSNRHDKGEACKGNSMQTTTITTSLLDFASLLRRDNITASLLNAGALPLIGSREDVDTIDLLNQVSHFLNVEILSSFAVWIINYFTRFKLRDTSPLFQFLTSSGTKHTTRLRECVYSFDIVDIEEFHSSETTTHGLNSKSASATCSLCSIEIIEESQSTFQGDNDGIQLCPCGHFICSVCFWGKVVMKREQKGRIMCPRSPNDDDDFSVREAFYEDLKCPVCSVILEESADHDDGMNSQNETVDLDMNKLNISGSRSLKTPTTSPLKKGWLHDLHVTSNLSASPSISWDTRRMIASRSHSLWLELPLSARESACLEATENTKKSKGDEARLGIDASSKSDEVESGNQVNANETMPLPQPRIGKKEAKRIAKKTAAALFREKNVDVTHLPFQGLKLSEVSCRFIGSIRSKRCEELRLAAVNGNIPRLLAIIEAGVNLDDRNEYGQTALFLATWHCNLKCVQILLSCGASANVADNAGIRPPDICSFINTTPTMPTSQCSLSHHEMQLISKISHLFSAFARDDEKGDSTCEKDDKNHQKNMDISQSLHITSQKQSSRPNCIVIDTCIPNSKSGTLAYIIDDAFDDAFLQAVEALFWTLPVAPASKPSCSNRSYYCDSLGFVQHAFHEAVRNAGLNTTAFQVWPQMRFLHYEYVGGCLPPHVDLSRTNPATGVSSTHTFIFYLSDCDRGGETVLLKSISQQTKPSKLPEKADDSSTQNHNDNDSDNDNDNIIYSVSPKKGRLLLFPHLCPHEGKSTEIVPKLLLRGEVLI